MIDLLASHIEYIIGIGLLAFSWMHVRLCIIPHLHRDTRHTAKSQAGNSSRRSRWVARESRARKCRFGGAGRGGKRTTGIVFEIGRPLRIVMTATTETKGRKKAFFYCEAPRRFEAISLRRVRGKRSGIGIFSPSLGMEPSPRLAFLGLNWISFSL